MAYVTGCGESSGPEARVPAGDRPGDPVSVGTGRLVPDVILRLIGYIISAIPLSLGFLWIAIDGRRQGWHDKFARTYVIPSDQHFSADDAVTFVQTDRGRSSVWLVVWVVLALIARVCLRPATGRSGDS